MTVGRQLGEFTLMELLSSGGQGAVYRAEQRALGREAAVKISSSQVSDEAAIARFLRETRLAARFDHPYAAHIYASGAEPDGVQWVAMELVRGNTLGDYLEERGPIPLERFVPLLDRIAEVVHSAHEQGIVHRDLKPGNVMLVSRAGRMLPKLVDFGIARAVAGEEIDTRDLAATGSTDVLELGVTAELTRTGQLVGSPAYMAPEQWLDASAAGPPADVYSLTALTYQALTGRLPFKGTSVLAIAKAHGRQAVPPLGGSLPPELDEVMRRGMAKSVAERYSSALELAAAVRRVSGAAGQARGPQLDQALRDAYLAEAPQPIAEAVAGLEAARTPDDTWDAIGRTVDTVVHWLGVVALACRHRVGAGGESTAAETTAFGVLHAGEPKTRDWIAIARAVCRPFADRAEMFPLPELVRALTADPFAAIEALRAADDDAGDDAAERRRRQVVDAFEALERLLRAVRFTLEYPLVVAGRAGWERWTGTRRSPRAIAPRRSEVAEGQILLLDGDGTPVLTLAPLVQIAPPAPGAADELFLAAGKSRHGATLRAPPAGFELPDETLSAWIDDHVPGAADVAAASESAAAESPYLGLQTFSADDVANYFGREQEVATFLNRMRVCALLVVVGPSGTGKSSFVQAGVVPALPTGWRTVIVRPGATPIATLAAALGVAPVDLAGALRPPILLVVDQLEELFTLCHDTAERTRYGELLVGACANPSSAVRVILTLRDDFLVRAEQLAAFRNHLTPGLALLATPAREDLLRILQEPARRAGFGFDDPTLPGEMADAVADQPGALALLSFTASKLWELRDRQLRQLTRKAYDAMGGVGGALAKHAEDTLAAMTVDDRALVREAFRHLVTAEGTRAILTRAELTQVLRGGAAAERVIERLVAARLCVIQETTGGERVEVIHEALLEAWPRLVGWRREDADNARLRDQLRATARQWHERGRPHGLLWRDDALAEYRLWRARYPGELTTTERAFADASLDDAARGRRRRRWLLGISFAVLASGAIVMALLRAGAARSAEQARARLIQSYVEQGRQALLANESIEALVYLTEVRAMGVDSPALRLMLGFAATPVRAQQLSVTGDGAKLWSADLSPDGHRLLTAGDDGSAKVWDAASGQPIATLAGHTKQIYRAVWSPDGSRIGTASADGSARLWTADGKPLAVLASNDGKIEAIAFSPSGARVVTCGESGVARVWEVSGALVATLRGHKGPVPDAVFLDEQRVVTAGIDHVARIWDVALERSLFELAHADQVTTIAGSADGKTVATGSWDGTAKLWNATDGHLIATLVGHGDRVDHVQLSPDGTAAATAGRDGTARIWDATTGALRVVLRGHRAVVGTVAWDRASRRVVTGSDDRSVRVWDATSGRMLAQLAGHGGTVSSAKFSADGERVVTASFDGTAKLWSAHDPFLVARWPAPGGDCDEATLGVDHRTVAVACGALTRVVDLATLRVVELPGSTRVGLAAQRITTIAGEQVAVWQRDGAAVGRFSADAGEPQAFALSPDGQRLAIGRDDGRLVVWDVSGNRRIADRVDHRAAIIGVGFFPDGRLVTASAVAIHVLDSEGATPLELAVGSPELAWIAQGPDGNTVVGGGATSGLRLFRVDRPGDVELPGHTERIVSTAFDRDGKRLLTASGDASARWWDLDAARPIGALLGSPNFLTDARLDPSAEVATTIGGDGTARFWDLHTQKPFYQLAAYNSFGQLAGFTAEHQLVTVSWGGEIMIWRLPAEDSAGELEELVRCRSPLVLDHETGGLLPAVPVCR